MKIPKKVSDRLSKQIGIFQKVLFDARHRDVNESDTVIIVTDMLSDVFGWNKYTEITSEQAIRGTFCDLAVTVEGAIQFLIEVKAVGISLKDGHMRQAIGYGANHGVPWVVLTNGISWEVYRIVFEQPISHELVFSFDFTELSARKREDQELIYLLCRSGVSKNAIKEYHERVQVVNRFVIAAIIQSDKSLGLIRRELKRIASDSKVSVEEIQSILSDVLKRDVLEGDTANRAKKQLARGLHKSLRKKAVKKSAPANTG